MKQSLNNLTRKVETFSEILENKGHAAIQQATTSPHLLCLQCRIPGKTYYIYLGRGAQYQGFDYGLEKLPTELRVQDKFLQFARHYWRGMKVLNLEVSNEDRVLSFKGVKESVPQEMIFFWRGRDLFFVHIKYTGDKIEVFRSWEGKVVESWESEEELDLRLLFKGLGYAEVDFGKKEKSGDLDFEDYLKLGERVRNESRPQKYSKKIKKLNKMKGEYILLNNVDRLRVWTSRDLTEVDYVGEGRFKVSFRGLEGHYKKREFLFDKIKGWERSRKIVKERIDKIENEEVIKKEIIGKYIFKDHKIIQPIWKYEKRKTAVRGHQNYIEINYRGMKCFLGRRAQENDYIRKELGKKEDTWIHLEGLKSGHMIVKNGDSRLDVNDLTILSSALIDLNSIAIKEIPIVFTALKNVKSVKGNAGMVIYKKEKHLKVYYDEQWRKKLSVVDT